jgi:hypothetical protein
MRHKSGLLLLSLCFAMLALCSGCVTTRSHLTHWDPQKEIPADKIVFAERLDFETPDIAPDPFQVAYPAPPNCPCDQDCSCDAECRCKKEEAVPIDSRWFSTPVLSVDIHRVYLRIRERRLFLPRVVATYRAIG